MRVELFNDEIVVSYKESEIEYTFKGNYDRRQFENYRFINDITFAHLLGGYVSGFVDKRIVYDWHAVLVAAKRHGVEVDPAVYKYLNCKDTERKVQYERERAEKESQAREREWQLICKDGCPDKCENLGRCGDDYICRITDELLDMDNKPTNRNGVYCLFNYVPMPSANCPHNPNLSKEDAV